MTQYNTLRYLLIKASNFFHFFEQHKNELLRDLPNTKRELYYLELKRLEELFIKREAKPTKTTIKFERLYLKNMRETGDIIIDCLNDQEVFERLKSNKITLGEILNIYTGKIGYIGLYRTFANFFLAVEIDNETIKKAREEASSLCSEYEFYLRRNKGEDLTGGKTSVNLPLLFTRNEETAQKVLSANRGKKPKGKFKWSKTGLKNLINEVTKDKHEETKTVIDEFFNTYKKEFDKIGCERDTFYSSMKY